MNMLRMSIKSSTQGKSGVPDTDLTKRGFKLLNMQSKRLLAEDRDPKKL